MSTAVKNAAKIQPNCKIKDSIGYRVFSAFNYIILTIICLITFVPFYMVVAVSFTSETSISKNGYQLFPKDLSLDAYKFILNGNTQILTSYMITITVTVVGTFLAVFITAMLAYCISRNECRHSNKIAMFVYFTMVFNAGTVPWYIVCTKLGLHNSIWGLILPMMVNPWNMFLIRNYFKGIPNEIMESARLDGAGEFKTFVRIVLPLSLPGLATITLFYMLAYWNDWWNALMFIDEQKLYPLQFLLRQVLSKVEFAKAPGMMVTVGQIPSESVKMATCCITIGPIILVYPFIQKYFVKGITVGGVKG